MYFVPSLETSFGGWCLVQGERGTCGGQAREGPIVAVAWASTEVGGMKGGRVTGALVVQSNVASVAIPGQTPIPTSPQAGLPDGLRGVAVEGHYADPSEATAWISLPEHLELRTSNGEQIPLRASRHLDLLYQTPASGWHSPQRPPSGVCQIATAGLAEAQRLSGAVLREAPRHTPLAGRPMYACATTNWRLEGATLKSAVLIDATLPGITPGPLLGARPLPNHTGVVESPGVGGPMLARRIPHAWLAVQGGDASQQRRLLEHLVATVRL